MAILYILSLEYKYEVTKKSLVIQQIEHANEMKCS